MASKKKSVKKKTPAKAVTMLDGCYTVSYSENGDAHEIFIKTLEHGAVLLNYLEQNNIEHTITPPA